MNQDTPATVSTYDFTVHTFGCKVNTYDSGLLEKRFSSLGHQSLEARSPKQESSRPRVHILNTCAVTAEASKEAAKLVRRIKSREPFATVVVTGCGAQVDAEIFDQLKGADLVVANSHKGSLERILDQYFKGETETRVFRSNIFRKEDLEAGGGLESHHTRSFLKIQDGCNSFCTYCVIPFARGKSRSIPVGELVQRVRELENRGVKEVVLTGVHIGDYEDDSRPGQKLFLEHLISEILAHTAMPRLRLSSLEPVELTSGLMSLYKDQRLCPHFHMSIQSANTSILSSMRRKYDALAVEDALHWIQRDLPQAFVGMDVIVGFPGEGEDEFADTYERLERLPWTRIHVFPYSERPGTKAINFEGRVARDVRFRRSERLRELSSRRYEECAASQIGKSKMALVLNAFSRQGRPEALTRDYWPVEIDLQDDGADSMETFHSFMKDSANGEVRVRVTALDARDGGRMDGRLVGVLQRGSDGL